jgi:hypothetical protein
LISFAKAAAETLRNWSRYKEQTGQWPWMWIAIHILYWIVTISGLIVVEWRVGRYHLSRWGFAGVFVLIAVPYALLSGVVMGKVKVLQLKRQRALARERAFR